jgi:hypothetical protein
MKIKICLCFLNISIQMVSAFAPLRGVLLSPAKGTNKRRLQTDRAIEMSNGATSADGVDLLTRPMDFLRFLISETSGKEFYIIGSIFAVTAARLVFERQKQKKQTAEHGDQFLQEALSLKKMPFIFTSLATVAASLIVPFLDLDATLLFAEITPFGELELVVPSLEQVELVDSAYDMEDVLDEINISDSQDGNERAEESTTLASTSKNIIVSHRMLMITGITIGVCGTALTQAKRTFIS